MAWKYYAQPDELGFPIPGTMMSGQTVPKGAVEIPAASVVPGAGQRVVAHPGKLRFFVRRTSSGAILPNSLTSARVRPRGASYEFKLVR